jgi:hypothetical protein
MQRTTTLLTRWLRLLGLTVALVLNWASAGYTQTRLDYAVSNGMLNTRTNPLRYVPLSIPVGKAQDKANNTGNSAAAPYSLRYAQLQTATPVLTSPVNNSTTNSFPTFAGTAPAGADVRLYLNTQFVGILQADGSGNFSGQFGSALPNGTYTTYVTAQLSGQEVSAGSPTITFTIGSTRPVPTISSTAGVSGSTTNTSPIPFTVTFSKAVTGFVAGDVTVTNGTISGFSGSGTAYSFNVTPTTAGTATTVTVPANVAQDGSESFNTAASPYSISYVVSAIAIAPASLSNGMVAAAYSQTLTASGGTAPYTYAITAGALPSGLTLTSAGVLSGTPTTSGTFSFTVTATDALAASGQNGGSRAYTVVINSLPVTAAPVVVLPADGSLTNTTMPTYSGTAPVGSIIQVYIDGVALPGTTTPTPGGDWTITQPTAMAQGNHTIYATAQLSGQMVSVQSNTNTFTIDTVRPSVAISSTAGANGSTTVTSPIPFTVTFSEAVTGFVAGDVTVTNGTISGFSGSGTTYSFNVTPTASGAVTVNVPANVAQDRASNFNNTAIQYSISYLPSTTTVASVTRLILSPTATAQVSYRVAFSSAVTGLTTSNFGLALTGTVSGATVSSVSGSGTTYTVMVNTGSGDGTLRLTIANSAGVSPMVTNAPYTAGETYTITKSFAASPQLTIQGTGGMGSDVTAFVDVAQVLSGGSPFTNGLQNSSFETHVPLTDGNYGYQPTGASWTFSSQSGIAEDGSAFSPVTPIPNGIAVAFVQSTGGDNGQLQQNLAVPTGSNYQVSFRAAQRICCTSLDQALNVFLNGVFLGNIQPNSNAYSTFTSATFSVTAPALTATVSTTSASPTGTSPIPFSVSFSQSVGTTFTASNATVSGGTLTNGSFSGSGSGPYTFMVTPSASGTVSVSLAANVVQDANNTGNSASNTVSVQYAQPVTAAAVVTTPANGALLNTSTPTYSGTAPANSTVVVYVDTNPIGTTTANASGSWTLTQPMALAQGSHTVYATAQTSGATVSDNSATNNFTIDSVRPLVTISSTAGASGGTTSTAPVPFTVTFSENVTGFVAGDVTVGNGVITGGIVNGTSPGSTFTFTVTPTTPESATTVTVPANVAQDAAGNFNTAATQFSLTYQQSQTATPVVVTPANGSSLATNQPAYSGTASANSTVTVYVDGSSIGTTTATGAGSFSLTQASPLAIGSHTVYATAQSSGLAVSARSNTNNFTVSAPATYTSSTADQPSLERVQAGSTNQVILRVAVVIDGTTSPLSAQSFALTTMGSTSATDIASARLYYTGTSNVFAASTPFGSAVATPSGAFTVAGAQQLTTGTNYFWLVYNVAPAATPGNVLDATITSLRISGTEYIPSMTAPAGNRQIIQVSRVAGQALRFAGGATVGYVNLNSPTSPLPAPLLGEQYTQVTWIKPAIGTDEATYYVLGNGTGPSAAPYLAITGNGRIEAGFGTGTALRSIQTGPQTITPNAWNQVAATFTGTLLTIYLNGDAIATLSSPDAPGNTPVAYVGSAGTTGSNFFPGFIDEVSQWNRALSVTELRQLRHLTLSGTEANLVSYLQFNDAGLSTTDGIDGSVGTLVGASRVTSTAPMGGGVSNLQSVTQTGNYAFAGTNAAINFTSTSGTPYDVVVTRLEGTPLGTQVMDANLRNTHARAYWIVDRYSTTTFAATITYTLDQSLISAADAASPAVLKLYKRGSNSDGAFDAPISATAANATASTVTFPITSFSQTFIGTYGSSPLPVQLVRFTAEARGTAALLHWTTAQELNNNRFEVERSTDGRTFTLVGTRAGAGTSSVAQAYTFTDAQAGQVGKQVYYRLRQVDSDGKASFSSVEVVRFGATLGLVLWPNPSTEYLSLDLSSFPEEAYTVQVTDALGRMILTTRVVPAPATTISVAELPTGSYLLHVLGARTRTTSRFVKQK